MTLDVLDGNGSSVRLNGALFRSINDQKAILAQRSLHGLQLDIFGQQIFSSEGALDVAMWVLLLLMSASHQQGVLHLFHLQLLGLEMTHVHLNRKMLVIVYNIWDSLFGQLTHFPIHCTLHLATKPAKIMEIKRCHRPKMLAGQSWWIIPRVPEILAQGVRNEWGCLIIPSIRRNECHGSGWSNREFSYVRRKTPLIPLELCRTTNITGCSIIKRGCN